MNSAYVIMGLLYGEGDFSKTLEISTRCGQDLDCNPASAAGILGTMMGYSNIPDYWLKNVKEVEDLNFKYTDISLNKAYAMSFDQACKVIKKNKGEILDNSVTIAPQSPKPVRYEKSFERVYYLETISQNKSLIKEAFSFDFKGTGIVITGGLTSDRGETSSYVAQVEVYINDKLKETIKLPADYRLRKLYLFWDYQLAQKNNSIRLNWLNPIESRDVIVQDIILYTDEPTQSLN